MLEMRPKIYIMLGCLLITVLLLVGQVLANTVLLLVCLAGFFALVMWATMKHMSIPVLLYFLPWSPLLKLQPGTMSTYSMALVAVLLIYVLRNTKRFSFAHIFPAALLLVQSIILKTVTGEGIDNGYILFFLCLFLFPLIAREKGQEYDFFTLILYFSFGIIISAISAEQLMVFPTISRYITVHSYSSMTRLSGFYGDPNFYSAHITAVVSGALVIILNERNLLKKIVLYVMLIALLYCGFLSVSKSFALIMVCIAFLWIIEVLFRRGRISSKLMMLLALGVGAVFVLSSILFTDLIDMMVGRFFGANAGSNISDFTTGRTEIWISYFRAFEDDPMLLFFGKGFTDALINGRASHNIIIQSIYQFGLVGTGLLFIWLGAYMKSMLDHIHIKASGIVQAVLIIVGTFGTWLAIDHLMFDEFFLFPFFAFVGIKYVSDLFVDPEPMNIDDGETPVVNGLSVN